MGQVPPDSQLNNSLLDPNDPVLQTMVRRSLHLLMCSFIVIFLMICFVVSSLISSVFIPYMLHIAIQGGGDLLGHPETVGPLIWIPVACQSSV